MSEWKSSIRFPPPRDGTWVLALHPDHSGAVLMKWNGDEWIDGSGGGDLFEPDDFWLSYSAWLAMPDSFDGWADNRLREDTAKERYTIKRD